MYETSTAHALSVTLCTAFAMQCVAKKNVMQPIHLQTDWNQCGPLVSRGQWSSEFTWLVFTPSVKMKVSMFVVSTNSGTGLGQDN